MSDGAEDEPKDESSDDSERQSEQQPAESDQPSAQSDEQTDQSTEQSEEQPAQGDQPADQAQEQPTESDQPADQSEEQPSDESDQPAEQSEEQLADSDQPEEQPAESDQSTEQSEEQPADSDQPAEQVEEQAADTDQAVDQSGEQPADSDQPATAASADNALAFAGGEASPGGGGGGGAGVPGSTKTTKVQVIAIFMTNSASSPFRAGEISMMVFGGAKGNLLWKPGSMNQQQKLTYQFASKNNVISSGSLTVSPGDNVQVELRVRLLRAEHELTPQIPQVDFGTAARFEVPTNGKLTVGVDVETTRKEFTVGAKDEVSAADAAHRMLTSKEEMQLSVTNSAIVVGPGRFLVDLLIPTKRIRIFQPKPLEVIY
jgi:chemotaxis protein histidine kinase CheA